MLVQAAGGINLASFTQGSISVTQGQTVDLGTVILKPGLSLSGMVSDTAGTPLSNITVRATPSNSRHGDNSIQVTSDAQGNFTFLGLSPDLKIYDIVARAAAWLRRLDTAGALWPSDASRGGRHASACAHIEFHLVAGDLAVYGQRCDGGQRSAGLPGQRSGRLSGSRGLSACLKAARPMIIPWVRKARPVWTVRSRSGHLVAGTYDMTVESLGYQPYRLSTGWSSRAALRRAIPAITLQKGAELDATLARPEGSLVNSSQVDTCVAVSQVLTSIFFGQASNDANTGNNPPQKFSGFLTSPQRYNVLLFDKHNNIPSPPEGRNRGFISSHAG